MKYIFVTGGVVSSLGKGLTAASLGTLLEARTLRVVLQKFDPYLNVDPGTMNPFQHGEVYVLKDRIRKLSDESRCDVVITEIGGTTGDIEGLPFLEAIRQFILEVGPENV